MFAMRCAAHIKTVDRKLSSFSRTRDVADIIVSSMATVGIVTTASAAFALFQMITDSGEQPRNLSTANTERIKGLEKRIKKLEQGGPKP